MDLFEETIQDLFNTADTKNVGYITTDDFTQVSYILLQLHVHM